MSTLRISDAPLLPDVDGTEKIPTGGRGDYAISVDQIKDHIFEDIGKELVGLGNVDNTSDLDKPISTAQQAALNLKADKTYVDNKLDLKADKTNVYTRSETSLALSKKADLINGVVPENQIPSSFNDVLEFTTPSLPIVGESGKIYVTTDNNKTWRWGGNKYIEISGWNPDSVSKSATLPTYYTKEAGVNPVTGVPEGAYFNVRSSNDESYIDEYQNVGGSAVATGKGYPSTSLVNRLKFASGIETASGQSQQEVNDHGGSFWHEKPLGYSKTFRALTETGQFVISTVDSNTVNPNLDMTGWEYDLEWMTGWVTPQMFGAKADGVTFDEMAIRKCLTYARAKKKAIWMGGANCIYRVKHYDPKESTFNYLFHITENTFIAGAGAQINVDHTTIPTTTASQYFMFAIERPTSQLSNYTYIVKNIYISGVKLDGGYVYENDTDKHNLNDKFKLRAISNFETRVNNFVVTDCEFSRFAQNNTIVSFFSGSFNNYGIGKGIYIDKCKFINNGYEGDHSTLYFMDDNVEITRCTFHIDKAYNLFGSHAIEFHGKDSYADNIHVYNYIGGVIFGTNTQSGVGPIGNSAVTNSVFRVYADACSLWSGETEGENSTGSISVLNNKADILADDGLILSSGNTFPNKAFFGIPIAGKPIEGFITIKGNSGKVYANVPTHIVDLAVGDGIDVPVVDIEGNNFDGATSMLHVISRNVPSSYYQSLRVVNNGLYHYANKGAFAMVLIESKNDSAHAIRSLLVSDNSIVTYVPDNATLIDIKSGYVERIYQSNNFMPGDSHVLNLEGGNVPQIYSNQPHNVNDYLSLANTSLKSSSSQEDILRLNIPASQIVIAANGTEASISLGFISNNTRITRAVGKLSDGISTAGIPINFVFKAGTFNLVEGTSVADKAFPVFGGDVSATNQLYPYATKLLIVDISSYDASKLTQLKNSGLSILVEVTAQKVYY